MHLTTDVARRLLRRLPAAIGVAVWLLFNAK